MIGSFLMRHRYPVLAAALAALVSLIVVVTVSSAADKPADKTGDKGESGAVWHKSCEQGAAGQVCFVEQFAIAQPKNVPVLYVRFDFAGGEGRARLAMTAPLGVLLGQGLQMSVDGSKPIILPLAICTGRGCDASAVLDKDALERFTKGKSLVVRYAVADAQPTAIPIRLDGLTDALKSLSK